MSSVLFAISFLTIIPVGYSPKKWSPSAAMRAVWAFPLVGAILGAILVGVDLLLCKTALPALAIGIFDVLVLIVLTGALHLDGLADSADGLFSHRSREEILEIMRDSRIGTMGAVALIMTLMMKIVALAQIGGESRMASLFLAPLAGRAAMVMMMGMLPYARSNGGLGGIFGRVSWQKMVFSGVIFLVSSVFLLKMRAFVPLVGWLVVVLGAALFVKRKIGGFTGDTLGAVCELAEVFFLMLSC